MELRNVKGSYDYLPTEQLIRKQIIQTLEEVFERYCFQPVETPVLNYYDLLASKYSGGSEIMKEVYSLSDQGNRELGLRYDLTVPFCKLIGMNPDLRMPFKRYEIGKVFRDGPIKTGRLREFYQCDVDIVGVDSITAEVEFFLMIKEVFKRLNLEVVILFNNRKLLSGIIEISGIESELSKDVILILDKLEKAGKSQVVSELESKGINKKVITDLFTYLEGRVNALAQEAYRSVLLEEGLNELNELIEYLQYFGLEERVKFTPSLARGLDIYTGTVWEIYLKDNSQISSSVGAGGRFDKIIGSFLDNGKQYPAVGMTFGLDVLFTALKSNKNNVPSSDIYVIPMGSDFVKDGMKLTQDLRIAGLKVDIDLSGRKVRKSLDYANKEGLPFVIILGENEITTKSYKLKQMKTGIETTIGISDFNKVKELIGN